MANSIDGAVAALNGFLGDRLGFDVTDEVNPRARAKRWPKYTAWKGRPARGGAGPIARKRFYRWVLKYADQEKPVPIYFVGKSYGAHWILDAIEDLKIEDRCEALLFDPTSMLRRRETFERTLKVNGPISVTVVRQLGCRSGYRVDGAEDKVIDAKHENIERTRLGRCILDEWLTQRGL